MTSQNRRRQNTLIVRRLVDALGDEHVGAALCRLDDQATVEIPAWLNERVQTELASPADFQPTGVYRGRDAVRGLLLALKASFEIDTFLLGSVEARDDEVVVRGHFEGRRRRCGAWHAVDWVQFVRVARGKVIRVRVLAAPASLAPLAA